MPDLAVILTANSEIITARLDQRGRHDRFEDDPRAASTEVAMFRDASETLTNLGVAVLQIDTGTLSPQQVASEIADALAVRCASLSEHG
jgi:dTMP kinase